MYSPAVPGGMRIKWFIPIPLAMSQLLAGNPVLAQTPITGISNAIVYGYSANATYFPTNTEPGTTGGIDMVAITGVAATNFSYVLLSNGLIDFKAQSAGNSIQLSWTQSVMDNLKAVSIQRSPDGDGFEELFSMDGQGSVLGAVPGAPAGTPTGATPGSSPSGASGSAVSPAGQRSATDRQPLTGKNYYRLAALDKDGRAISYSAILSVVFSPDGAGLLKITPNPVKNGQFVLLANGQNNKNYRVIVFNPQGRPVFQQQIPGAALATKTIVLPGRIPAGTYIVQLEEENGNKIGARTILVTR